MFGSTNPFGHLSNCPFGSQSVFGQSSNASNNPFAPKPFGSTIPLGSQTGGFIFGGTSTGVFGVTQSSSSFSSVPASGASSSPAFGSSMPAFGASSTPAFGSSSSAYGGSSCFGQKPAFGGVGSTSTQTSPFGSTSQPSQPAFGSGLFGSSTPFGASSQPAFGATSTVAFGDTSTPAFGATSMPAFGATSTPAFGSTVTSAFGKTGTAFGASSSPMFGSGGEFGASITPAFGASSTSAFASSSTPAFGASSSPSFSFSSSPAFGQSTSAFGGSLFGAATSPFGAQATTPTFGGSGFGLSALGGQRGGSRATSYTLTAEADGGSGTQPAGKLESIAAMPVYKDKSHEELHWEDYQLGDKGGPNPASHPGGSRAASYTPTAEADGGSGTQPAGKLESISAMPVYKDKSHEELHWEDYQLGDKGGRNPASHPGGFGAPFLIPSPSFAQLSPFSLAIASNPFSSTTPANPFSSTTSSNPFAPKPVGSTGFGSSSPPLFGPSSSSTRTSVFGSFGFGQSAFGGHRGGSRVAFYTLTAEADGGSGTQPAGKLESISAMPVYNDKSHEELRWEDYQLGDKGGPNRASQPGSFGAPSLTPPPSFAQSSPFSSTTASNPFSSTSANPFSSTITSNPFAPTSVFSSSGFGHSAFGAERGGSRAASYTSTAEVDGGSGAQPVGQLESISAMPVYEYKSHEELHWEDYQLADKVGPNPASQPGGLGAPSLTPPSFAQSSPFSSTTASNPFSSTTPANPFSSTTSSNLFSNTTTSNPFSPKCFGSTGFGSSSTPLFGPSSSSMQTSVFGSSGFGQSAFGGHRGGSRVASYTLTAEADGGSGTQPAGNLESISAMPVYKDKSHDELHWEDHQLGDKGCRVVGCSRECIAYVKQDTDLQCVPSR